MDLYFGLNHKMIKYPAIYCALHKVYLDPRDVKRKKCNVKGNDGKCCKHLVTKNNWNKII